MCSIAGSTILDKALVRRMNAAMRHRGPDDSGVLSTDEVVLGHNRLSIIDLSAKGHQPMTRESLHVVYNGEIYNYRELREELGAAHFHSTSDTEVLLMAYKKWGPRCVERFNGMWAFCIYDEKKHILFLSRDRTGKKPLYYYWDGRVFMFASELKGLLAAGIKRRIDRDAASLYMSLGFIPAPHSIIEGVWKLEAGQNLLFSLRQKTIRTTRFYIPPTYEPQPTKNLVPRGRELLEKAVHYRSIADVDVGTFLSGGLDSSIVTALLQRQANRPIHSFSIGFELAAFDESRYARLMAEHLGTKHHHAYFTEKDYARIRKRIPDIYDEPLADTSIYPTVKVAELAARYVKACLTGEGGDELFGGYALHRAVAKMDLLFRMPVGVRKMGAHLTRRLSKQHRLRRGFALSLQPHQDLLANIFCRLPADRIAHAWYKKHFAALLKKNGTLTESVIRFDLFHHTVPDKLNVKVDRAGMASSLEIRCPFLDKELLSFSAQIPTKHKLSRAGSKTKVLLRSIAKPWLPREILQRKKQGFSAPAFAWVQNEPETIVHAQKELRGLLRNQQRKQLHAITQKITARQKLTRYEEDRLFRATLLQQWRERWEG